MEEILRDGGRLPFLHSKKQSVFIGETTELHKAAREYDAPRIASLLEKGENMQKDEMGNLPLHTLLHDEFKGHLYSSEMLKCVKILLLRGCSVINEKDCNNETPLSLAVHHKFEECVKCLLKHGADTAVRTNRFKTRYSLALAIARNVPDGFTIILDRAVTIKKNPDTKDLLIKLDWRPVLQKEKCENKIENGMGDVRRKYKKRIRADRETRFLYKMLDVPMDARSKFLNHPLVTAFMYLKEKKMRLYLTIYQVFMVVFTVLYLAFVYIMYFDHCRIGRAEDGDGDEVPERHAHRCSLTTSIKASGVTLAAFAIVLFFKEVYLPLRTDTTYLKNWNTWASWICLLLMGLTLWPVIQLQKSSYNFSWQYPVASLGAFFSGVLLLVHFELIPYAKLYLEQLVRILLTVLKIILLFLPIFVGLHVGFNIMFFQETNLMNFLMMAVDPGSDLYEQMMLEIAEDGDLKYFTVANLFCAAFVLIISIVFINYLLAASVDNIQELKRTSRIVVLSKKVETIFSMEVFVGKRLTLLSESKPSKERYRYKYNPNHDNLPLSEDIRANVMHLLLQKNRTVRDKILRTLERRKFLASNSVRVESENRSPPGVTNYVVNNENRKNNIVKNDDPGCQHVASPIFPWVDSAHIFSKTFTPGQYVFVKINNHAELNFGIVVGSGNLPKWFLVNVNGTLHCIESKHIEKAL